MKRDDKMEINNGYSLVNGLKFLLKDELIPEGHIILLTGPSGIGKTTFALNALYECISKNKKRGILVTFEESPKLLKRIAKNFFRWNIEEDVAIKRLQMFYISPKTSLKEDFPNDLKDVQLVVFDGISRLRSDLFEESENNIRGKLNEDLFNKFRQKEITTLLIAEETKDDDLLEYLSDGIIRLFFDKNKTNRNIQIQKMRLLDFHSGSHFFKIVNKQGIKIYPALSAYFDKAKEEKRLSWTKVSSGVGNLDELINEQVGKAFNQGEIILLIGGPGTGKTLFGMSFIHEIENDKNNEDNFGAVISFDYSLKEIKKFLSEFDKGTGLKNFLNNERKFVFKDFYSDNFHINEVSKSLFDILVKDKKNSRLFIDGIASLRRLFDNEDDFLSFITQLIKLIKKFDVTTIISYDTKHFFKSYSDVSIGFATDAHTIIGLRMFEENNKINRGLIVLKSLGKQQETSLKKFYIKSDKGVYVDLDEGWSRVGMISGASEGIHEEKLFFKFFYQNEASSFIYKKAFSKLKERYPDELVVKVVKNDPIPTHWSFTGKYGSGHSNTKVVCLRKHLLDVVRNNKTLSDIPDDLIKRFRSRIYNNIFWNDIIDPSENYQMIPEYIDIGVLAYQKNHFELIQDINGFPSTWKKLLKYKQKFKEKKDEFLKRGIHHLFVMPNLSTDMETFIMFLFEIFWSHGEIFFEGKYEKNVSKHDYLKMYKKKFKDGKFHDTFKLLRNIPDYKEKLDEITIPNPLTGGHYHKAIFSRRWFSKILLYDDDAKKRMDAKRSKSPGYHEPFEFDIRCLPKVRERTPSISCLDMYCLGIIKGALAPETGWMFVSDLLHYTNDYDRFLKKRGLSVIKDHYKASEFMSRLDSSPDNEIYNEEYFKNYSKCVDDILNIRNRGNRSNKGNFKRVSDIPFFYNVENILSFEIGKIFNKKYSIDEVQELIVSQFEKYIKETSKRK